MCFVLNMCTCQLPISSCDITHRTKITNVQTKDGEHTGVEVFSIRQKQFKTFKRNFFLRFIRQIKPFAYIRAHEQKTRVMTSTNLMSSKNVFVKRTLVQNGLRPRSLDRALSQADNSVGKLL